MTIAVVPEIPHNIEAEQAVLGAILIDNGVFGHVSVEITEDDFYEPAHRAIYRECARRIAAGRQATPVTLKDALPDVEIAEGMTLPRYLARLCAEAVGTMTARSDAVVVRELAHMREIIAAGADLSGNGPRRFRRLLSSQCVKRSQRQKQRQKRKTAARRLWPGPPGSHRRLLLRRAGSTRSSGPSMPHSLPRRRGG